MFKKRFIIVFSIVVLSFFICILISSFNISNKNKEKMPFNINENIDINNYILNRFIKQEEEIVIVGKNNKEIENGYIDIKIEYFSDKILTYFNKIYKEEKVEKIYVDENYLLEILNYINDKFSLNMSDRDIKQILILTKDKYMDYRLNEINEFLEEYSFETKYKFSFSIIDNMLMLKITFK